MAFVIPFVEHWLEQEIAESKMMSSTQCGCVKWIIGDEATLTGGFKYDILEYILNYVPLHTPKVKWIGLWCFCHENFETLSVEIIFYNKHLIFTKGTFYEILICGHIKVRMSVFTPSCENVESPRLIQQ